ncbi:DUF1178 family protein [Ruegeria aquimaris]|uniref:DUF1178 family protein n=1 Tax=Ruegeria aquimaris TaxID=2984333 RepID=A0ABT3AHT2_9RHOB|nr:DUF1178 family protein [Ruegeria sp. XHP0148]MCV2888224.1 DUF1178 family protein [Ruegeria sp. XHP0148]
MIQYSLKCSEGHSFESWFQSATAFDKLAASGLVCCAICGGNQVEKAMMTPRVRPARSAAGSLEKERPLSTPASSAEQALAEFRKKIEQNSDYVGKDFAAEARKMHLGETPERSIYGEARVEDAKALLEDGIPVSPLPFLPNRKAN